MFHLFLILIIRKELMTPNRKTPKCPAGAERRAGTAASTTISLATQKTAIVQTGI